MAGLRTQCMQCGGHYQPTELLRHLLTVHPQACAWATQIAFQLYDPMQHSQNQDFRCDCCTQVYNLPGTQTESLPDRLHIQRSHFVSNCPVVLQIAILLHPIHGRADGSQRPGPDGGIERLGPFAAGQSAATRGSRRRAAHQASQGQSQKRLRRPLPGSRHLDAAADGATDPQPRKKSAAQPTPGLLRYVLPKPPGGHSATPHMPGQQMAGGMAEAAGQPELAQPAHLLAAGSHQGAPTQGATTGQQQTRGTTLGCGTEQGHDPSRWSMGLPEVVGGNQAIGQSPKKPMPMATMLRTLETLEDLLDSNQHVVQFRSLRTDQTTIPWLLQLTHRETEAWDLLGSCVTTQRGRCLECRSNATTRPSPNRR